MWMYVYKEILDAPIDPIQQRSQFGSLSYADGFLMGILAYYHDSTVVKLIVSDLTIVDSRLIIWEGC